MVRVLGGMGALSGVVFFFGAVAFAIIYKLGMMILALYRGTFIAYVLFHRQIIPPEVCIIYIYMFSSFK